MIDARELRIGNRIQSKNGSCLTVESIYEGYRGSAYINIHSEWLANTGWEE